LNCVRLLLEAGASLDAVEGPNDPYQIKYYSGPETLHHDAFEYARQIGNADLVRMLDAAARLRYSPSTHRKFPPPARYAAAELLRLGYQIGSGVLVPAWAEHVIPFLVSRTSRGAVPTPPPCLLFIDALSDEEVEAMLDGDYAEHAALELDRRADAKRAECVALAARLLAGHRLGPQSKRFFQLICECGGDSEKAAERLRAGKISKTQSRGSPA